MSQATYLGYSDSVRFLKFVHRSFQWPVFLLKNAYNLTPGYAPIPCRNERHDITFEISDLKSLAYQFAQGKITQEHIHEREEEFMKKFNSQQATQANTSANESAPETETSTIEMTPSDRLDKAIGDAVSIAKALYVISLGISTFRLHTDRQEEEIEALRHVTEDYYDRAYQIVSDLQDIHEELFDDDEEPNISDDELEALMGALEGA